MYSTIYKVRIGCIIDPYHIDDHYPIPRLEEQCLVRSGLVKLLDHLCSLVDSKKPLEVGGEEDESLHRVTSLAWAAFQVLADHCVSWETQNSVVLSSGLAQQVRQSGICLVNFVP